MPYRLLKLRRTFRLSVLLGLFLISLAAPVHAEGEEETVARNFLRYLGSDKGILSAESLEGDRLAPALSPVTVGHLFHLRGGGYLLVSPNRSVSPIKAYSLTGDFAALPPPYREAILAELELRARVALAGTGRTPLAEGMTETEARWDFLLRLDQWRLPLEADVLLTPLLQTKWNQTYPYNKFLPAVDGQTVAAGCVNVALAQVMRYYGRPASSQGVISYTWTPPAPQSPEVLKTILYRGYNWANMPDRVDATTPEYQADEVALLIRDLGIANRTAFDAGGSSTSLNPQILLENFGYSTGLSERGNGPDQDAFAAFLTTLKEEIAAERPVLLTFPGHMVVADGYRTDGTGESAHINMGWGGTADDFYFLDSVDYKVVAGGHEFATDAGKLNIYYKIKPCSTDAGDCAVNLETGDVIGGLAIAGDFNQAKDTDIYEVYLKGPTTLRATRGYDNLAFFLSIVNPADGSIVFQVSDPNAAGSAGAVFDAGSLPAGKYAIRVSFCNDNDTYCYGVDANNHYTVTLTSGTPTPEEKAAIDKGLDKPPVIGNAFPDLILNTNSGTRKILIDARDENGDPVTLRVKNSNPAAVGAVLNGNLLEVTPKGTAKVSARIVVAATANGQTTEKAFTVLTDEGETAYGTSFRVSGTFIDNTNDFHKHRVILDGACSIHGDNGFTTQGFYSSVLDAGGAMITPATNPPVDISGNYDRAVYQLGAALYMESNGSTYRFTTGIGAPYFLEVSCQKANTGTETIADLLGISLAGAGLPIASPGDVDGSGGVTLTDAILALQILRGNDMTGTTIRPGADVDGDWKIGMAEALFILQTVAGLRAP